MEITTFLWSLLGILTTIIGWHVNKLHTKMEEVDSRSRNNSERITSIETTFTVLGDINEKLGDLKIDVEVLKSQVERLDSHLEK